MLSLSQVNATHWRDQVLHSCQQVCCNLPCNCLCPVLELRTNSSMSHLNNCRNHLCILWPVWLPVNCQQQTSNEARVCHDHNDLLLSIGKQHLQKLFSPLDLMSLLFSLVLFPQMVIISQQTKICLVITKHCSQPSDFGEQAFQKRSCWRFGIVQCAMATWSLYMMCVCVVQHTCL